MVSLDGVKATPNVFYLEENSDLAWEMLCFHLGDKQHIASSYNQGKTAFTQMLPTRDFECIACTMFSAQGIDTRPNASMLRKATLTFSPLEFYTFQEINQSFDSCSLSSGSVHRVSIPWKTHQTGSPLRRSLIRQENSFFSISWKSSTELVHTTWGKWSI